MNNLIEKKQINLLKAKIIEFITKKLIISKNLIY